MAPLTSRPPAHRRFHETLVPVRRRFASPRSAVGGRPLALRRRTHTTVRKPICDARGVRTLCPRDRRPEYRSLPIRGCRRERPRQKAPSERPGETARCVRSRHRSTLPRSATAEKADRALSRSQTGGRDGDVPKGRGTPDHPTRFVAPPIAPSTLSPREFRLRSMRPRAVRHAGSSKPTRRCLPSSRQNAPCP